MTTEQKAAETPAAKKIGWDSLFMNGSVVDLDVSIWTARTSIRAKDLGIEETDDVNKALSLGCTRLAPKAAFDKIREAANRAKRFVEWHSLTFPFVRGARYIPASKMEVLMEKLRECREQFDGAVNDFVSGYAETKAKMIPIIEGAFREAAKNAVAAEMAISRIKNEYPTEEEVRRSFELRWVTYAIRSAKDEATAEGAAEEAESVKGIVRAMVKQLREEFQEKVGAVMSAVAKGGKIPSTVADSANEVLSRCEEMNIFQDAELTKQVAALRQIIKTANEGYATTTKTTTLITDLVGIQKAMAKTVEDAVAQAEANLSAVGRRKIVVPKGAAA